MDLTWLILLVLIGIISSIANRRSIQKAKEHQEKAESEERNEGAQRRPASRSPQRHRRTGQREPRPAETAAERPEAEPREQPSPSRRGRPVPTEQPDRELFEGMRRQLRERHEGVDAKKRDDAPKSYRQERDHEPVEDTQSRWRRSQPAKTEETPLVARISPKTGERRRSRDHLKLDTMSLRNAVILKEILDKPIALREHTDPWESY